MLVVKSLHTALTRSNYAPPYPSKWLEESTVRLSETYSSLGVGIAVITASVCGTRCIENIAKGSSRSDDLPALSAAARAGKRAARAGTRRARSGESEAMSDTELLPDTKG